MRDRWVAEIRQRTSDSWPDERQQRQFGDRQLLLPLVESAPLLRALGLLDRHGDMSRDSIHKFLQINHMVKLLEPTLLDLVQDHPVVRILDAACGSSYLTLLLAWCFEHRWRHPCQILGVDHNPDVVVRSGERASQVLLDGPLRFAASTIRALDAAQAWAEAFGTTIGPADIHALVALHACDTATDEAIALGVELQVDFIGVAPCCQAELARKWATLAEAETAGAMAPIWASNHLRREAAATMTDALRTLLLRGSGYRVTAMEFVRSEHTPKNTLLRALRAGHDGEPRDHAAYQELKAALGGVSIRLEELLVPAADPG